MEFKKLATKEKALRINLNPYVYGSFAEIGAGQEVAATFFKAGGASGTIAKTMSAYDMAFSDAIYGAEESGRYVCEPRVIKMIDKEYGLLVKRLPEKAPNTCFFGFANTVEIINYSRTNDGHGWLGVRFQLHPQTPPNECIIHVLLKDNDPILQQQAVGVLGVNLIYACFYHHEDTEMLLSSLIDELNTHRVEVDYFRIAGPDFSHVDNRLFSLKLVKNGLAKATMFGPDGSVLQPAEELYKKNLLVLRGRFRPVTHVNLDMMERSYEQFKKEPDVDPNRIVAISELNLHNLKTGTSEDIDEKDFLDRVDILCSLGQTVMISGYQEYFKLIGYLSKLNRKRKIGLVMGIYNLESIFQEKYYQHLDGGIMESFGVLFGRDVKLYIYPSLRKGTNKLMYASDIELPKHLTPMFEYLKLNNKIEDVDGCKEENLHIISDSVLEMIKCDQDGWEKMVPDLVAKAIKDYCLFDYPCGIPKNKKVIFSKRNLFQ